MLPISIKTIPHREQRYNTVGDYESTNDASLIRVSDYGDTRYEFLTAMHELVESFLCRQAGVTDAAIDEFDFAFVQGRPADDASEPGDQLAAPYHRQHEVAKKIERILAEELGVDWAHYDAATAALMRDRAAEEC